MCARSGHARKKETELPSVSWPRHARRTLIANGNCEAGAVGAGCLGVRTKIVRGLVENYGVGVAEVARQVGISTSGVSKILSRTLSN
jgi:hypothetical protein